MILFIDDEREFRKVASLRYRQTANLRPFTEAEKAIIFEEEVVTVRTPEAAREALRGSDGYSMIFFDNDLGSERFENEGRSILKWYLSTNPPMFEAYFHTSNIVAREAMESLYQQWRKLHQI